MTLTDVLEHIPEPRRLLGDDRRARRAGRVRRGEGAVRPEPAAEGARARGAPAVPAISLADNLVHVNHFSPGSLRLALERAGFAQATIRTGAPELLPPDGRRWRRLASNAVRLGVYAAASLPGAVHTPLALNLQAYATRPAR